LFIEPQDEGAYRSAYPSTDIVVLGENDRGVAFARQSMLEYTRANGWERYWQIDDNIRQFGVVVNKRVRTTTATDVLTSIEDLATSSRIVLLGPDFALWAWNKKLQWRRHGRPMCCKLTSTTTGINYDQRFQAREDIDFCIATLAAGWETILVHKYTIAKPKMGTVAGGLDSLLESREQSEQEDNDLLISKWPQWCIRPKSGRVYATWAKIRRMPTNE